MFSTVRMRFLSTLDPRTIQDLDALNQRYFQWLEEDYVRKAHAGLNNLSPHDVFMSQVPNLKLISDANRINEDFLIRITRKIQHDATTQLNNILYETDSRFAGKRVEIRYEPDWINDVTKTLPIFQDGKKIGEARVVRFHDNAHAMRKFKGNRRKDVLPEALALPDVDIDTAQKNTISYYGIMKG